MFNLIDLTGRKIIVTGASSGIGRDTAVMLSRLGAKLVLLARNEKGLQETLSMCEGVEHHYHLMDVSDLNNIENVINKVVEENGAMDGLVYCAGMTIDLPLASLKPEKIQTVLQTNLGGFIEVVRCITKRKNFNSGMRIVAISSVAATIGSKGHIAYAASKAGMNAAVRCMAIELAKKGICINTIAPANIDTPMISNWIKEYVGTDMYNQIMSRQYLGMGETKDVGAAAAFLVSPVAKFITGANFPVDGGYTSC